MSLGDKIEALKRLPIFMGFELEALRLLAFGAQETKFGANEEIFRQGEKSHAAYLILTGVIVLDMGREGFRQAQFVGPGALIGERALLTETQYSVTGKTSEPTVALKISRDLLRQVLDEFPHSAVAMRDYVAKKIGKFRKEIETTQRSISI